MNSYYRAGDKLYSLKENLEEHLRIKEKQLFNLTETIILYDLTNTYFEGKVNKNSKAKYGNSKEKRKDCKLITLGMVLDEEGFIKNSKLFPGNQTEGDTLSEMILYLSKKDEKPYIKKTIVMDAGIAVSKNIKWIQDNKCWQTIKRIMESHCRLTVLYKTKDECKELNKTSMNYLRICSEVEPEQKEIYQKLNISAMPLPNPVALNSAFVKSISYS